MEDNNGRTMFDKKSGTYKTCGEGKDDDGPENDLFEVEEAQGEQFMALRPWIGQIAEPRYSNTFVADAPDCTYALEYVYGYRCADSKQNVYWNCDGEAVYMTAALGVILNCDSNTQKFFGSGEVDMTAKNVARDTHHHTDDVLSIAVCNQRKVAVSGQNGSSPTIFKWNACTGEKMQRIKVGKGARGIAAVSITEDGWVAAVDLHNEHQVYVFDQAGNCVWKEKGDTNKINDVCWDNNSKKFCTAGVKHIYFWNAES